MNWLIKVLLITLAISLVCTHNNKESFSEELLVRPLPDGNVLAHIQFSSTISLNPQSHLSHFELFPKTIAQVFQSFNVEQMQIAFTTGRWNDAHWGVPVIDAPSGVQLMASFQPQSDVSRDWYRLTQALSGMFCSSLGTLDETQTSAPHYMFSETVKDNAELEQEQNREIQYKWQEQLIQEINEVMEQRGENPVAQMDNSVYLVDIALNRERMTYGRNATSRVRYGELPTEAVCTENLTPWIKLLPCRDQSGLGKLLHPLPIYDSKFNSMNTVIKYRPSECPSEDCPRETVIELIQTLTVVFATSKSTTYSVASLFGEENLSACKLSNGNSRVFVQLPVQKNAFSLSPQPETKINALHQYTLTPEGLDLVITRNKPVNDIKFGFESPVLFSRTDLGSGEVNGAILSEIINTQSVPIEVTYFDYLPWYFPVYFHSIRVFLNGHSVVLPEFASKWRFKPSEDHGRPSEIEIVFTLPANARISITFHHEKAFLLWTEHPPDAHRGHDIPSARLALHFPTKPERYQYSGLDWSPTRSNKTKGEYIQLAYSDGLLVLLPTPDFSMPYNVITLTCTMFAIVFTTTVNIMTRRFSYLSTGGEYASGRLSLFLYRKVRDFLTK